MKPIIPDAALEQHTAILGKTGSGKTYTAKAVIVEPLLERGAHVGLVDPADAWWGLRSSRDGKGAGYPVLVLGGPHGDLPLPANGGEAVARLLIEQRVNLIACTKGLTVGERTRWAIAFFGTINRLNQRPLYLVVDEAHQFAPQGKVPDPDTGRMLHEVNTLASGGRGIGVRFTMITQRPQKLHKDTLTCADTLIALRVLAPHDRDAVKAWIDGCGDPTQGRQVLDSLAGLKRGEGWVWYPEGEHLLRAKFPAIRTFDSSATPSAGQEVAAPKKAAEVDLAAIRAALADAVKEAEANDPKLLRVRISDLERELKKGHTAAVDQVAIAAARQEGREEGARDGYAAGLRAVQPIADRLSTLSAAVAETIEGFQQDLRRLTASAPKAEPQGKTDTSRPFSAAGGRGEAPAAPAASVSINKPMPRAMLTALAQHPDGLTKGQILVHTGYRSSGPVSGCFADLARNGWAEAFQGRLRITDVGRAALGAYEPLPTGAALREHLLNGSKCSTMEKAMLRVLFGAYPEVIAKGKILEVTGYASSGPVSGAFARLVALGYAKPAGRGALVAAAELFNG